MTTHATEEPHVERLRRLIEEAYRDHPTGTGGTFGEILCHEIHENGMTFRWLAQKWGISLPTLGELIWDHCKQLQEDPVVRHDLAYFPKRHTDHSDDQANAKSPDPEELQRLLGQLVESISPLSAKRSDQGIRLRNFRSDRYDLVDDLMVIMEERDGEYLASSFDTDQYGHGYSPDAAIHHLCSVIEDYYELLLEDEGHLSDRLNGHLRYLRSILRERE